MTRTSPYLTYLNLAKENKESYNVNQIQCTKIHTQNVFKDPSEVYLKGLNLYSLWIIVAARDLMCT